MVAHIPILRMTLGSTVASPGTASCPCAESSSACAACEKAESSGGFVCTPCGAEANPLQTLGRLLLGPQMSTALHYSPAAAIGTGQVRRTYRKAIVVATNTKLVRKRAGDYFWPCWIISFPRRIVSIGGIEFRNGEPCGTKPDGTKQFLRVDVSYRSSGRHRITFECHPHIVTLQFEKP